MGLTFEPCPYFVRILSGLVVLAPVHLQRLSVYCPYIVRFGRAAATEAGPGLAAGVLVVGTAGIGGVSSRTRPAY